MKKNLLITFDYELFLGNRSGNISDCLFEPTDAVLKVIEQCSCKAIFFVDTTYLLTLKKYADSESACKKDFEKVSNHILSLIKRGHYVFPHIHPHWLSAEYIAQTNEWRLTNVSKYRFHFCSVEEREQIFSGSVKLLKEIVSLINPDYRIDGYRAGGWCIQPFTDFIPFFQKHQIKYEFSVLGGFYMFSTVQYFDFSEAPEKAIYKFNDDVIEEKTNGKYTQFNISSLKVPSFVQTANKILVKLYAHLLRDHSFNRGQGQIASHLDKENFKPANKGHDISNPGFERVAIELLSPVKLPLYNEYFRQHDYMHFISHPKMLTGYNIRSFNKFLKQAVSSFEVETDFKKMI